MGCVYVSMFKRDILICHFLFHTVVMFWGNSCHSIQTFQMQKKVIRIVMGCGNSDSCRILVKKTKNFATYVTIHTFSTYICS